MDIFEVELNKSVLKSLRKIPKRVVEKLFLWVDLVQHQGIRESRKVKSFHDEPLKGSRIGQRSIRLSLQYRAIYIEKSNSTYEFIEIQEVNAHAY